MKLEWTQLANGRRHDAFHAGNAARIHVFHDGRTGWSAWHVGDESSFDGGIIPAGPTALADAKLAAEKALQPVAVDPLDAEAKRLGVAWGSFDSNSCDLFLANGDVAGWVSPDAPHIITIMRAPDRDTARRALLAAVAVLLDKPAPVIDRESDEPVDLSPLCKHCGQPSYNLRHIPGQGKTHEFEPVETAPPELLPKGKAK